MYCPHCTAWNEDDAARCGYCGRDLTIGAPAPSNDAQPAGPAPPAPPPPMKDAAPGARHSAGRFSPAPPPGPPSSSDIPSLPAGLPPFGRVPVEMGGSPGMPPPGTFRPSTPPRTSPKAVWSLWLGILGILCSCLGLVFGLPGLILALLGRNEIARHPERFTGRGVATAGIVTNIVALAAFAMNVVYFMIEWPEKWKEFQAGFAPIVSELNSGRSPVTPDTQIIVKIIPALESYRSEHGAWPAWGIGPTGANAHALPYDPAWHIPTFRIWSRPEERGTFHTLTTPQAYLMEYPADQYAGVVSGKGVFGYYTNGRGYIVFSAGPNGLYEVDPFRMYSADRQQPSEALINAAYDPSNGVYSPGDIWYVSEQGEW